MRLIVTILVLSGCLASGIGCSGDQPAHRHETTVNINGSHGD